MFRILVATLALAVALPAAAQAWPYKPVRIIVPFPPGGGTDIVAPHRRQKLARRLGPAGDRRQPRRRAAA